MKKPWEPPDPIKTLLKQLKEGDLFSKKADETVHDAVLVQ